MPFMADGGGGVGAPPVAPVTMQVEPDKILALKARYEAVRDTVQEFLVAERDSLLGRALAEDEVSQDAAGVFSENATLAIDVITRFIDELNLSIDQLDQAAQTYKLTEDTNRNAVQQQGRSI